MEKTVCELFAGVGGFRCGLTHRTSIADAGEEKWRTVWFNQWEPADRRTQWAHGCYVRRFGTCLDRNGEDTTNADIHDVDKRAVPDHNLLVGGFPCQDYSVASSLATSRGLEGRKGVLWWDIRELLEVKGAPFVLLENVDRLLISPAAQRGRDFGVILACFRDLGYMVEWRVINAADYGYPQRRRRIFLFACKDGTGYARSLREAAGAPALLGSEGFFARNFPVQPVPPEKLRVSRLPGNLGELSDHYSFVFANTGIMMDGIVYTAKTEAVHPDRQLTLGDVMETGEVEERFFVPDERLYYTLPEVDRSDESAGRLPAEARNTWQYLKGAKRIWRKARNGHEYMYSEGPVAMVDACDKPARTMLTSEGGFSRSTHLVRDRATGRLRLLTPIETERLQGFPSDWTKEALIGDRIREIPDQKRRFMMGNALVVDLIAQMEPRLAEILEREEKPC